MIDTDALLLNTFLPEGLTTWNRLSTLIFMMSSRYFLFMPQEERLPTPRVRWTILEPAV